MVGWLVGWKIKVPFQQKIGYLDKVFGEDLVPPG